MNDKEQIIDLIYKNHNYPGKARLTKLLNEKAPDITKQDIINYLEKDTPTQITKVQHKAKPTGHIAATALNELWNLDIFDLQKYHESNDGYKYLMVAIDIFLGKPLLNLLGGNHTRP